MITLRKKEDRGKTEMGWLDSSHTFSFGEYYDPKHMGFSTLRVINDDWVEPGKGFGTHPHKDMEILTYVLEGALEHKDSLKNGSVIHAGEIQIMSAGTGIFHSEFNHSSQEKVHFLQIWILPEKRGLKPRYDQKKVDKIPGQFIPLASSQGEGVKIFQDATVYLAHLSAGQEIRKEIGQGRQVWIQMVQGTMSVLGHSLQEGDGMALEEETLLTLSTGQGGEALVFDLA